MADTQTIDTYNKMAEIYDAETADFWRDFPNNFLDVFANHTLTTPGRDAKTVLNIGSGPGRDGVLLKNRKLEVTRLDASHAMVAQCKKRGLAAIEGDFMTLPFADKSFDAAWAYTSLLHVKKSDVGTALAEIARILKSGGTFGLGLIEGTEELYRPSSEIASLRWFSFYTKEEVETLLAAHGFKVLYFDTIKPGSKRYLHFVAQK